MSPAARTGELAPLMSRQIGNEQGERRQTISASNKWSGDRTVAKSSQSG
jgi:hypothetical protein